SDPPDTLITARSAWVFDAETWAGSVRPSLSATEIVVAPSITWALVRIQPAGSTIIPEPTPVTPPNAPEEDVEIVTTAGALRWTRAMTVANGSRASVGPEGDGRAGADGLGSRLGAPLGEGLAEAVNDGVGAAEGATVGLGSGDGATNAVRRPLARACGGNTRRHT